MKKYRNVLYVFLSLILLSGTLVASGPTITPFWLYTNKVQLEMSRSGNYVDIGVSIDGATGVVTKIEAYITLEKEVTPGVWETVKSWPKQTSTTFYFDLRESVYSPDRKVYRLTVNATVYVGSDSEQVSHTMIGTY